MDRWFFDYCGGVPIPSFPKMKADHHLLVIPTALELHQPQKLDVGCKFKNSLLVEIIIM
jgi:hypothetical protein